jgi:tricorn protease
MPADGGTPKQLTYHTGGSSVQGWTPDGSKVLIHGVRDHDWKRAGADRFFLVSSADRSAEELLFDDYGQNGCLSPDGRKLLFSREGPAWWRKGYHGSQAAQIWLFDLDPKSFRKILDPDRGALWPLWKPDGRGFYYVGGQGGSFNLREYDLASGEDRQITKFTDDSVVYPCISQDGSTIVFRHLFDFYRLKPGNGEPQKIDIKVSGDRPVERKERRVLTQASQVSFTQDGLEVAFIAGGDLWVMDTELREPKRVTATAEEEKSPVFAPDCESILFVSDAGGQTDIWRAEKADKGKYWFQNTQFKLTRVTTDGATKSHLTFGPDGKRVAFNKDRGELWVMDADGQNANKLLGSFSRIDYDWAPDGKWMVVAMEDNDFNRDIYIVALDGSRRPFNLSRSPYNDGDPVWSPDGKMIAYVGRHSGTEIDIHYVWLKAEDDEISSHDRSLEKALDKINKVRRPGSQAGSGPRRSDPAAPRDDAARPGADSPNPAAVRPAAPGRRPANEVVIDFDKLAERVKVLRIPDSVESNLFWSSDGKKLAFTGTVGGTRATYSVEFPDSLTPRQLSAQTGIQAKWLRTNQVVWLSSGVPAAFTPSSGGQTPTATPTPSAGGGQIGRRGGAPPRLGAPRPAAPAAPVTGGGETESAGGYRFQALQEYDVAKKNAAVFDLAWRTMRDNFYDERLGNRDWNAVRAKYIDVAAAAPDSETLTTVIQLMLGELNGSHLGFTPTPAAAAGAPPMRRGRPGPAPTPAPTPAVPGAEPTSSGSWSETTAHLGVRFDPAHRGPGLKVRDVLPNGPADHKRTRIAAGELVVAIDGTPVDPATDLTRALNGPPGREVAVKVRAADGQERDLTIRPIAYAAARQLLYDKWLADNRAAVEKLSGGKLGYLHIRAMDDSSFHKFEKELYDAGAGKEGLVIDVRENGGGSTTDHLLTALTQPVHAITVPRGGTPGYPQDRKVYATWNKPIVVLCNQNSFSNAEIFSHAIKTLNRGQLVGVPTAGGVISTGAAAIMDAGTLRLPFRGWYTVNDGEDMELHGAVPQYVVWPEPAVTQGPDAQIAKAVEVLLADVQAWKTRPQPPLRKATERK